MRAGYYAQQSRILNRFFGHVFKDFYLSLKHSFLKNYLDNRKILKHSFKYSFNKLRKYTSYNKTQLGAESKFLFRRKTNLIRLVQIEKSSHPKNNGTWFRSLKKKVYSPTKKCNCLKSISLCCNTEPTCRKKLKKTREMGFGRSSNRRFFAETHFPYFFA